MANFQEKYFEAINSLMSAQEENYKLKNELAVTKEIVSSNKNLETLQKSLIEALDTNAKLESKIAELKKSKISTEINLKREIQNLKSKIMDFQETFSKINNLNQELTNEGKCILCSRTCSCHLHLEQQNQRFKSLKVEKSAHFVDSPRPKPGPDKPSPKLKTKISQSTKSTTIKSNAGRVFESVAVKENFEKIKPKHAILKSLENVKLSSWRSVVKENRPKGSLAFLPKKTTLLIEEGIMNDFLVGRVEQDLIPLCKVEDGLKSVPAIPDTLVEEFDEWLDEQSQIKKDDNLISWMDIAERELGKEILKDIVSDMDYHHRVVKAIRLYLKKFAPSVKVAFESCWIRNVGQTENVPAIPRALLNSFLEWFKTQLDFAFYSQAGDAKRKAESVFVESSDDD